MLGILFDVPFLIHLNPLQFDRSGRPNRFFSQLAEQNRKAHPPFKQDPKEQKAASASSPVKCMIWWGQGDNHQ